MDSLPLPAIFRNRYKRSYVQARVFSYFLHTVLKTERGNLKFELQLSYFVYLNSKISEFPRKWRQEYREQELYLGWNLNKMAAIRGKNKSQQTMHEDRGFWSKTKTRYLNKNSTFRGSVSVNDVYLFIFFVF